MPFASGTPKPAGSGRQKSTQNRVTVTDILRELKCDPIAGMAKIAMDDNQPTSLRGKMYAELAQYLHAKRRSVELTGADGGPVAFTLSDVDRIIEDAERADAA